MTHCPKLPVEAGLCIRLWLRDQKLPNSHQMTTGSVAFAQTQASQDGARASASDSTLGSVASGKIRRYAHACLIPNVKVPLAVAVTGISSQRLSTLTCIGRGPGTTVISSVDSANVGANEVTLNVFLLARLLFCTMPVSERNEVTLNVSGTFAPPCSPPCFRGVLQTSVFFGHFFTRINAGQFGCCLLHIDIFEPVDLIHGHDVVHDDTFSACWWRAV